MPDFNCTGGTGLLAQCTESILGVGSVGVRVQLEPCGNPAFAETSYQLLGGWESADRVEAGGEPALYAIPGATVLGAGLFISVSVAGNAADMSVHAHLSVCVDGACDADASLFGVSIGASLTGMGFPIPLLEFNDLSFTQCPAAEEDDNTIMMVAAGAGVCAVVVLAIVVYFARRKSSKALSSTSGGTEMGPTPGTVTV
jgi:hypothetical protein